jgi:hypothetical protein
MQSTKYLHNSIILTNFLALPDFDVSSLVEVTSEVLLKTIEKQTSCHWIDELLQQSLTSSPLLTREAKAKGKTITIHPRQLLEIT